MTKKQKKLLMRILISTGLFAVAFTLEHFFVSDKYILCALYFIPYITAGGDVIAGFFRKIIRGKFFDEEFLMTIATFGAFLIGEFHESVFVMVFFQTGELFQNIAVGKSRQSISHLMELSPDTATVLKDGTEQEVFPDEIEKGDTVLVRPGEKIPVDGKIIRGESALNTSALTGESAPREVYEGDSVNAGTINLTGTLEILTLRTYEDSTAAKILELVENSTLNKAKTEKFLTRFARYYTPSVVICALLIAVIPSVITGNITEWLYRALIFLVVSCPCALVISVPLSFFGGIGSAAKKGILVKGGNYLEALSDTKTVIFDKTGTLTTGEFTVSGIFPEKNISAEELLSLGATAEYHSTHPIAKSITAAVGTPVQPTSSREYAGGGIEATLDGDTILAGSRRFFESKKIALPGISHKGSGVYIAKNGIYMGYIKLSDTPKDTSGKAIHALSSLGVKRIIMLTGDNESAAEEISQKLGISEFRHSLLPSDKAEITKKICAEKNEHGSVVFVGDGINDAPVLALSDVGIAMGGIGSDAAIEAADIVIMDDYIEKCAEAIKTARKTRRIVRQNVALALTIKFGVLILASLGFADMWLGVIADVGVAVAAILNALRALKS